MKEPELRRHQRGGQKRRSGDPERRRDQWNEWDEPDRVLRRYEPSEGKETSHRRSRCGDEPLAVTVSAGKEPDHQQHRADLRDAGGNRDPICGRAGQVA